MLSFFNVFYQFDKNENSYKCYKCSCPSIFNNTRWPQLNNLQTAEGCLAKSRKQTHTPSLLTHSQSSQLSEKRMESVASSQRTGHETCYSGLQCIIRSLHKVKMLTQDGIFFPSIIGIILLEFAQITFHQSAVHNLGVLSIIEYIIHSDPQSPSSSVCS